MHLIQVGSKESSAWAEEGRLSGPHAQTAEVLKQHIIDLNTIKCIRQGEMSRHDKILAERLNREGRSDVAAAEYEDTAKVN